MIVKFTDIVNPTCVNAPIIHTFAQNTCNMKQLKSLFAASIFVVLGFNLQAQAPGWDWARSGNGGYPDADSYSVTADGNGNSYITGRFATTLILGNDTLKNTGSYWDYFIAKYDSSGRVRWAKSVQGLFGTIGYGISTDSKGYVFVTGSYYSPTVNFGGHTLTNSGAFNTANIFVAKYDSLGNVIWVKTAGGYGDDIASGISTDTVGSLYITGYFSSGKLTFGSTTFINTDSNTTDVFIVKYDTAGNVLWAKSAGGVAGDQSNAVSCDGSGNNVCISGFFASTSITFGTHTLTNVSGNDIFVAKYDASGNVPWAQRAGEQYVNWGLGTFAGQNGVVYATGGFESPQIIFGNDTLINSGVYFAGYLVKYDTLGNVLWAKGLNTVGNSFGYGGFEDKFKNVYYTGTSAGPKMIFGNDTLTTIGSYDIFLTKYDSTGMVLWAKNTGGTAQEWSYAMAGNKQGDIFVTGYFNSTSVVFGKDTETDIGGGDNCYVAKINNSNVTTAIGYMQPSSNAIKIFPNPMNTQAIIYSDKNLSSATIAVYNINGQLVKNQDNLTGHIITINRDELPAGMYFFKITESGVELNSGKLIIQ